MAQIFVSVLGSPLKAQSQSDMNQFVSPESLQSRQGSSEKFPERSVSTKASSIGKFEKDMRYYPYQLYPKHENTLLRELSKNRTDDAACIFSTSEDNAQRSASSDYPYAYSWAYSPSDDASRHPSTVSNPTEYLAHDRRMPTDNLVTSHLLQRHSGIIQQTKDQDAQIEHLQAQVDSSMKENWFLINENHDLKDRIQEMQNNEDDLKNQLERLDQELKFGNVKIFNKRPAIEPSATPYLSIMEENKILAGKVHSMEFWDKLAKTQIVLGQELNNKTIRLAEEWQTNSKEYLETVREIRDMRWENEQLRSELEVFRIEEELDEDDGGVRLPQE